MLIAIFWLAVFTFIPGFELRASIPVAFFAPMVHEVLPVWLGVLICFGFNVLVGFLVFELMRPAMWILRKWGWFERRIWPVFLKKQAKLHPYVEKYGEWGLALFIGVPLPGTGAYTGAVGAYLLGLDRKRFHVANFAGVVIACVCVTALCVLVKQGAISEKSPLRKIFINDKAVAAEVQHEQQQVP